MATQNQKFLKNHFVFRSYCYHQPQTSPFSSFKQFQIFHEKLDFCKNKNKKTLETSKKAFPTSSKAVKTFTQPVRYEFQTPIIPLLASNLIPFNFHIRLNSSQHIFWCVDRKKKLLLPFKKCTRIIHAIVDEKKARMNYYHGINIVNIYSTAKFFWLSFLFCIQIFLYFYCFPNCFSLSYTVRIQAKLETFENRLFTQLLFLLSLQ